MGDIIRMGTRPCTPVLRVLALRTPLLSSFAPVAAAISTPVEVHTPAAVSAQASASGTVTVAGWIGQFDGPTTTISYQISFRNHVHNSMAEYLVEAQTTISMMCDRSASTPRTELIAVSKAKGVDARGIPPRGAPD